MAVDFDGASKAPTKPSRFAPKSSKLKPQLQQVTKPQPDPLIPTKKEELVSKPSVKDHPDENGAAMGKDDVPLYENTTGDDVAEEEQVAMDTDSVEDEVVHEIDVFFPNSQLYVFQYPLRPVWRPYELEERCQEVRLRPSTAQMVVDLAIDFDSKIFDRDSTHAVKMEKQTLSTSWMPLSTCTSEYVVGVLIGDKLHLNPIHAVVQLRPSQQHLKERELKKKNIATSSDGKTVVNKEVEEKMPVGPSKKQNKPPGKD